MKPRTPQEDKSWQLALESIGDRVWNNADMYFAMVMGGICGFCLGLIVWMLVKYGF